MNNDHEHDPINMEYKNIDQGALEPEQSDEFKTKVDSSPRQVGVISGLYNTLGLLESRCHGSNPESPEYQAYLLHRRKVYAHEASLLEFVAAEKGYSFEYIHMAMSDEDKHHGHIDNRDSSSPDNEIRLFLQQLVDIAFDLTYEATDGDIMGAQVELNHATTEICLNDVLSVKEKLLAIEIAKEYLGEGIISDKEHAEIVSIIKEQFISNE